MLKKIFKKIKKASTENDLLDLAMTLGSDYESLLNNHTKKENGIYYTAMPLAEHMVNELFQKIDLKKLTKYKFLEPCVGVGNFVFAYLFKIKKLKLKDKDAKEIIKNIYVAETDKTALRIYTAMVKQISKILFNFEIEEQDLRNRFAKGLMIDLSNKNFFYNDINSAFPEIIGNGGFDIIITNPPYRNLKAEKNKYRNFEAYLEEKKIFSEISKFAKSYYKYANEGTLNIYKLFVEEIIDRYSSNNAIISLLIPSSILTDRTCKKIRENILKKHKIEYINVVEENSKYVNAQQGLASILLCKNREQGDIKINGSFSEASVGRYSVIKKEIIMDEPSHYSIFNLKDGEYSIIDRLKKHPQIKSLSFIHNLRGELDLTLNKKSILSEKTNFPLIRGRHIGYYRTINNKITEYVDSQFKNKSSKTKFINRKRIACQQIANMKKDRRINFTLISPNYILANSCNFITVDKNAYGIDAFTLLGIMNSTLINWLFKLTSSNNHINNYELDMLPIPLSAKNLKKISDLTKRYTKNKKNSLLTKIDREVNCAYGLNKNLKTIENKKEKNTCNSLFSSFVNDFNSIDKTLKIKLSEAKNLLSNSVTIENFITQRNLNQQPFLKMVISGILGKYQKILANQLLNHETSKLSSLDLEMIKEIPQGGNWKNIPIKIVEKSRRLKKITQTGGRTTLYGRIDYSKPAYTITTYFNRPGNGTYVHPVHNRVISNREAARFQSFPDNYYFYGNKTDILKQIGNAVPPFLAFQIGKLLIKNKIAKSSIDLFAGAGGLTLGLKNAGINSIASVDNFEKSCVTLKINNPEVNVICGNIEDGRTKKQLYNLAKKNKVDLVCGGPPCQGFSHAGKRFIDDPRNSLFREYLDIVSVIKPKVFLLENVPGMLTLDKGSIYKEIINLFSKLGYMVEGRLLLASEFGIPQKRRRLIIIGVKNSIGLNPSKLFPTANPKKSITAKDAIFDLESTPCAENAPRPNVDKTSDYIKSLNGIISVEDYLKEYHSTPKP